VPDRQIQEIHRVLVEHDRMLAEALRKIRYLESVSVYPRNRKLQLMQLISRSETLGTSISGLARILGLDRKTVRRDLAFLAGIGFVAYQRAPSRRANPGREGTRPRLTEKGRLAVMRLDELDRTPQESWGQTTHPHHSTSEESRRPRQPPISAAETDSPPSP